MTVVSKAAFARELGVTATRVSQHCRDGLPVRRDGRLDREAAQAWVARNVQPGYGPITRGDRRVKGRTPAAEIPLGLEAVERADNPIDRGMLVMGLMLTYRAERLAAAAFTGTGAPMAAVYAGARRMAALLSAEVVDICRRYGAEPVAGDAEPDIFNLDAFEVVDWKGLAKITGERHDLKAWAKHAKAIGSGKPGQ